MQTSQPPKGISITIRKKRGKTTIENKIKNWSPSDCDNISVFKNGKYHLIPVKNGYEEVDGVITLFF